MGPINNNLGAFQLIDGTDSSSEIQQLVLPARKKRFRRRLRNNPTILHDDEDCCHLICRGRTRIVLYGLLTGAALAWILTLTWLAVVLNNKVYLLNHDVDTLQKLVAAHQGVPDALHACHTLSRELHKNQSDMSARLTEMALLQRNFTLNLTRLQDTLSAVQQQLNASPSIVNDPRLVNDLSKEVADFGSKIQDLQTTVTMLKEQDLRHDGTLTIVSNNVTDLHGQVASLVADRGGVSSSQLADTKASILDTVNGLAANLTSLRETFTSKLNWTEHDQTNDHATVVSLQEMDQNITARLRTLEGLMIMNTPPTPPQTPIKVLPEQQPSSVASTSSVTDSKGDLPPPLQFEKHVEDKN